MLEKRKDRIGFGKKFYRKIAKPKDLVSFEISLKETDLWISAKRDLKNKATELVLSARNQIESYIRNYPEFMNSLVPWKEDPYAPPLVKEMITASKKVGIGPMAAVAGAIAEYVGKGLLEIIDEVIVENGGDVFLKLKRKATVSIFSGKSYNLKITLKEDQMPAGICSSSSKIGHSLSFGNADIVTVISDSATFSDALATAIGNMIKRKEDLEKIKMWTERFEEIKGIIALIDGNAFFWGKIEVSLF